MSIIFVSESTMLQDMLEKACEERDLSSFTAYETIKDIPKLSKDTTVLLHITSSLQDAAMQVNTLRRRLDDVRIVILAREKLTKTIRAGLAEHTQAIIPEKNSIETLIGALLVVKHGYRISKDDSSAKNGAQKPAVSAVTLDDIKGLKLAKSSKEALLSERERAILTRLSEGGTNKDIAKDLGIQEATVKVHLRACFRKIGARNRTQAAVWAVERLSL